MADEEKLNLKELKEEIWAEFGDQLRSYGASRVQDFFLTIGDQPFPLEEEVSEGRCIVHTLGQLGKYAVLAIRCGYKVGKTVVGFLMVFVTLMSVPDAIEQSKLMFPNTYEVVQKIASLLETGTIFEAPQEGGKLELSGKYIVFFPDWLKHKHLFEQDRTRIRQGQDVFHHERRPVYLPASSTSYEIVSSSSGPSDHGDDETA